MIWIEAVWGVVMVMVMIMTNARLVIKLVVRKRPSRSPLPLQQRRWRVSAISAPLHEALMSMVAIGSLAS
jgi:hypothetical protein